MKLPTVVGRGRNAGLTLPHPLVSRQHCEIYEDEGKLVVNDLGSLNGTFVGDQRINEPTYLMPGDLLTVGTVTFRAMYELADEEHPDFAADESTGTEISPSDQTAQFDRTVSDAVETVPVDNDVIEVSEVEEVDDEPELVEDVEEVEEVEEIEDDAVPQPADHDTTESGSDEDDDLQSFLKGLG